MPLLLLYCSSAHVAVDGWSASALVLVCALAKNQIIIIHQSAGLLYFNRVCQEGFLSRTC